MLVILAERPAQILDWLKTSADYRKQAFKTFNYLFVLSITLPESIYNGKISEKTT